MYNNTKILIVLAIGLFSQTSLASVAGSKHDLSVADGEICVYCHTPHGANIDLDNDGIIDSEYPNDRPSAPLWNRNLTDTNTFTPYVSPTMDSTCDATPSPLSLACLSCHDKVGGGAASPDNMHVVRNSSNISPEVQCLGCHTSSYDPVTGYNTMGFPGEWWQIGPNLSDDHPISMNYQQAYSGDGKLNTPPSFDTGWLDIKLFNGRVECPSCHNPHDPANVPFLRRTISGSSLCLTCHDK